MLYLAAVKQPAELNCNSVGAAVFTPAFLRDFSTRAISPLSLANCRFLPRAYTPAAR